MRRLLALVVSGVLVSGCAFAGTGPVRDDDGGPVRLTFQSLAYQEPSVAATAQIVADWNAQHPDVQVDLLQGSWDSVHDQLVTQFQGATAPDVIHDESADITDFARQGYLADLGPYLSPETRDAVPEAIWPTVTVDGRVAAVPTLLQSYVVFANTDLLAAAGVAVPDGPSWTWDELAATARAATTPGRPGLGWGLRQPTATVMSMGTGFGARFFDVAGDVTDIRIGDAELEVPRRIHDMAHVDRSLDPVSVTQSGSDVVRSFLAGRYAMVVSGNFAAQQILESAPPGFRWTVLPALAGTSPAQAANPQTLSVSAQSPYVPEAAAFVEFYLREQNLAAVARGEWLIPTTPAARAAVASATGGADGWDRTLAGADQLTAAPFQSVAAYPQWKDQIATPALQRYLADRIDLPTLQRELTDGWAQVAGRPGS